jgi:hypothetical protein
MLGRVVPAHLDKVMLVAMAVPELILVAVAVVRLRLVLLVEVVRQRVAEEMALPQVLQEVQQITLAAAAAAVVPALE